MLGLGNELNVIIQLQRYFQIIIIGRTSSEGQQLSSIFKPGFWSAIIDTVIGIDTESAVRVTSPVTRQSHHTSRRSRVTGDATLTLPRYQFLHSIMLLVKFRTATNQKHLTWSHGELCNLYDSSPSPWIRDHCWPQRNFTNTMIGFLTNMDFKLWGC